MDIQDQTTLLASQVRGIILDVDGVLTNGQINYSDSGEEIKSFHVQDGASIKLLQNQPLHHILEEYSLYLESQSGLQL